MSASDFALTLCVTLRFEELINKSLSRKVPVKRALRKSFPGGDGRRVTPVPISNTEVKPSSADGTALETVWESRTLPGFNYKAQLAITGLFLRSRPTPLRGWVEVRSEFSFVPERLVDEMVLVCFWIPLPEKRRVYRF